MRPDQRAEGERDGAELGQRRRDRDADQDRVAPRGAPLGQHRLDQRQAEGEDEGVVAELDDHRAEASWPDFCQYPAFFSASATSFGM